MVGVPRSTGCALCIRRRVRCDQTRPSCGNCQKYGSPCPGYDRSRKFVDGKHIIRQKGPAAGSATSTAATAAAAATTASAAIAAAGYNIDDRVFEVGSQQQQAAGFVTARRRRGAGPVPAGFLDAESVSASVAHDGDDRVDDEQQLAAPGSSGSFSGYSRYDAAWVYSGPMRRGSPTAQSAMQLQLGSSSGGSASRSPSPPLQRLDVLLARLTRQPRESRVDFISAMTEHVRLADPDVELVAFGGWFGGVPERLGRVVTLDSAACAFVLHLLGKTKGDAGLVAASRSVYGRSLVALQRALNHPVEWRSSETLCTTILLCLFELFNGTEPSSWMKHAGAVGYLMQQRGPDAFQKDWDRSMLLAFRGILIMNSLFGGRECFLAKRAWREVARHNDLPPDAAVTTRAYSGLADTYLALLAQLPATVHAGYALREASKRRGGVGGGGDGVDPADVALLVRRAARLRSRFLEWGRVLARRVPYPVEVPAASVVSGVWLGSPQSPRPMTPEGDATVAGPERPVAARAGAETALPAPSEEEEEPPPFETALTYRMVWDGALYMGYWASVAVLNTCLQDCGYTTTSAEGELKLEKRGVVVRRSGPGQEKEREDAAAGAAVAQGAPAAPAADGVSLSPNPSPLQSPSAAFADLDPPSTPTTAALAAAAAAGPSGAPVATATAATVDLAAQTHEMVHNILRSVDAVSRGAMGPYRIGYTIRIAYEFATVEEKRWIRSRLQRLSRLYAATNPSTFPPVEPPRKFFHV